MRPDQLRIVAPDKRTQSEELYDLFAKVFPDFGYYGSLRVARTTYIGHSHYDWQVSRVGFCGDQMVTHFGVWDYQMRIGTARVRTGGIGAVATHGDYRKQGLMDRTARASIQAMRDAGYDMTILFGIRNFYHKFGYVRAWAETNFFTHTGDLPMEKPERPLRRLPVSRLKVLADVYNSYYATYTGTAVRPTYTGPHPYADRMELYVWNGDDGRVAGYVLVGRHGHQLQVREYCGDAEQALRALGAVARRGHYSDLYFETLPYASDLARLLRRGNCRLERHYSRSGSAMIRMINLPQAISKLVSELGRRLQASPLAAWRGDLLISDTWDQVLLSIRAGKVSVAPVRETPHAIRGGDSVVQLLIGTDVPGEVIEAGRMQVTGEAARLAEVLFPAQYPQLTTCDRY